MKWIEKYDTIRIYRFVKLFVWRLFRIIGKNVKVGVSLLAEDMEKMVRFYRDILGFSTRWDGGSFAEFETASGELSFFIYDRRRFVQAIGEDYMPPRGINSTFEIALWLPSFADVDREYLRLQKFDLRFPTGAPQTFSFGVRNFYVADPEGNLLEIGSTMDAETKSCG